MTIETVKLQESGYLVNGNLSVPNDPLNRHYQEILDWINAGNSPEGQDVIEPDYVALRTGPEGYAPISDQLDMQYNGTWNAHIADVKSRFPKTITGSTSLADIPADLLQAAADKLFAQQSAAYQQATARLAQYRLAEGREEATDTIEGETVIIQTAVDPLPATVEQTTFNDETGEATTATVPNPLIVQDDAERAEAQAVIDATPQAVKDA